jgi:mannose-6-phosphate isomerase|tara:strand:+ start:406 stop:897 length:492 start_codon:yes stop_codon:yes gene_type:complete
MSSLEYRPWGAYEVLHDTSEAKVKIIEVEPGQRLSYQYHTKRKEQWTVIYGELTIILDDEKVFRKAGESIKIPLGAKHRAWNETDKPVRFIEVQTGTYFGEDDIVRLEDDYMRADDVQEFLEMADEPGPWPEEYDKVNTIGGLTMPKGSLLNELPPDDYQLDN